MTLSIYQLTVPSSNRALNNLESIIKKGDSYAEEKSIAPEILLNSRLFPDMLPFIKQVQIACDLTTRSCARLADADLPSFADDENSFGDLYGRIANSIAFINDFSSERFEGAEDRSIEFKAGGIPLSLSGSSYLSNFILPNIYFHITTSYNILRHNGVMLGKPDYLGEL